MTVHDVTPKDLKSWIDTHFKADVAHVCYKDGNFVAAGFGTYAVSGNKERAVELLEKSNPKWGG